MNNEELLGRMAQINDTMISGGGYIAELCKKFNKEENKDFQKDKEIILGKVKELLAVNSLEYHNKNWLFGDSKKRCEAINETLSEIQNQLQQLK